MERPLTRQVTAEVRAELGRRKMTNSTLAQKLGENEMWVSRRLRDKTPFGFDDLQRVAHALGLPMSTFLERAQVDRVAAAEVAERAS